MSCNASNIALCEQPLSWYWAVMASKNCHWREERPGAAFILLLKGGRFCCCFCMTFVCMYFVHAAWNFYMFCLSGCISLNANI